MMKLITCLAFIGLSLGSLHAQSTIEFKGDTAFGRLYDVTFDPVVANRVFALTLGNHVLESTDKGATWHILYSFPNNEAYLKKMEMRPDNKLSFIVDYTRTVDGVYILDIATGEISNSYILPIPADSTKNWVTSYSIYPSNSNYAIMHQSYTIGISGFAKVYYTSDGGVNWDEVYFTSDNNYVFPNEVAISPDNPQRLYIARGAGHFDESGGLLISDDAGATWELDLPQINLQKISFHPTNPAIMYMGTGQGNHPQNLYKSTDHGESWEIVDTTWSEGGMESFSGIAFNPQNPDNIIVMDGNEVAITENAGNTWAHHVYPDGDTSTYSYGTSASFNPFAGNEVFVGADWKPMFSTDGGATLTQVMTPFFQSTMAAVSDGPQRHLYYGVQSGFVHVDLATGTKTEHEIQPVDQFTIYDQPIYVNDPNHTGRMYEYIDSLSGATLYVSDDHGQTKTGIYQTFFDSLIAIATSPLNPNKIWASFVSGVVLIDITDPQNIIQTPVMLPEDNYVTSILPGANPMHAIIGIGPRIYATTDAGLTWQPIDSGITLNEGEYVWQISRNPFNQTEMIAATSVGIFKTADNGQNWTLVYTGTNVRKARYSDKTNGCILAGENTTFFSMAKLAYSVDGGNAWTEVPAEAIAYSGSLSMDFLFNPDDADVYISSFDLGLLKLNLHFENLDTPEFESGQGFAIYPNPATDLVHFTINGQTPEHLAIFDAAGKSVLTTSDAATIDVSRFTAGIYFVRAETKKGEIFIRKLVKK